MIIYISLESLFSITRLWSSGYDRGFPTIFAGIAKIRKQPLTRVRIPAAAPNFRIIAISKKVYGVLQKFYAGIDERLSNIMTI